MSEYDSDIEFDFFEEPETGERPPPPGRPRQRPPGGPPPTRGPEHPGIPPTARVVGLIAFGILVVVLLVLWVQSCSGTSKKTSYGNYLAKVRVLAVDSRRIGSSLSSAIDSPGIKAGDLADKMDGLAQQQQVDLQAASRLKAPSGLAAPQASLLEALQFRVSGLHGLAQALRTGAGSTNVSDTATSLAAQSQRLVASDVIWSDLFRQRALLVLSRDGVSGLVVPTSQFLQDQGTDSETFWTAVIERLNNNTTGSTSGKAIGTELVGVTALPKNTPLSPTNLNTVVDSPKLGFTVTVKNSGDVQVTDVLVTLTIKQAKPISVNRSIHILNPGDTTTVTFKNLPQPAFVVRTTLEVDVKPVPGETNPSNNSATYPVIFSLG